MYIFSFLHFFSIIVIKKNFRDHPYHGVVILGGTWGVKLNDSVIRKQFKHSFDLMFRDPLFYSSRKNGGTDQTMLKKYVW